MKKWVLYIISVVFCMGFFACTAEEDLVDNSADYDKEVIVSFALNIPDSRNASDTEEGAAWENYIDEVRIFAFVNDRYKEEVNIISFDENDGDQTRTLLGKMKSDYNNGEKLELVILTNMSSRGVREPTLSVDQTDKQDLYKQLVFSYTEPWKFTEEGEKKYIPMWGITSEVKIAEDTETYRKYDAGIIDMYRAVAKINITINDGKGLQGFAIKKLELCNVLNQGYCASLNTPENSDIQFTAASLPNTASPSTKDLEVFHSEEGEQSKIENEIYIPEIGTYFPYNPYFHIKITTTSINGTERLYTLYMRTLQTDSRFGFDIVRNHKYVFNINSITATDEIKVGYNVDTWGDGTEIDLPFN